MATVAADDGRKTGKGPSWNDAQNLALSKDAFISCSSPKDGASMTSSRLGKRIRASFIKDMTMPSDAGTDGRKGGLLDERRWDGRRFEAWLKQWNKMKRECTKFYSAYKRVTAIELTGSPSKQDIDRCATAMYNDGSSVSSHLYDFIRNADHRIRKPFNFTNAYGFLSSKTTLLDAAPQGPSSGVEVENRKKRSNGRKAAKADKKNKLINETELKESASVMAQSVSKM